MDQYIGKLLDNRYEIMEQIGMGGMARVFRALDHRLNRQVAVKILREDLAEDAELRRRFHEESQAVAMLSHPNIVAVYDVSRSSDLEYIVMELIDGITLKQYMQKKGNKLNWREALHFITQIVKALGHAHSRGIIHRDIKPHNIMVLRDGSVKVADFGIARVASGGHSTLTQEALGSVHYISPEQARGSHIDARSDLYSAGVVLYEMLTGRLPFEGDTPVSVAIQHINSIPLSPRELEPAIPEALEAITMKAMAPNPDNRYGSADEMLADLEEFRKNPSIKFDYTIRLLCATSSGDIIYTSGQRDNFICPIVCLVVIVASLYLELELLLEAIEEFGRRAAGCHVHTRRSIGQRDADTTLFRASQAIVLTSCKSKTHQEHINKCLYLFHSILLFLLFIN